MNGVDPYAYMQQVAVRMNELTSRNEIETVLDELEYLFEVIPPDMRAYSCACSRDPGEKCGLILKTKQASCVNMRYGA